MRGKETPADRSDLRSHFLERDHYNGEQQYEISVENVPIFCGNGQRQNTQFVHVVTDHFSGPGSALVPVCVAVCVRTMTFERNNV